MFFFLLWTFFLKMYLRTYGLNYVSDYTAEFHSGIFKYFDVFSYACIQSRQVISDD